MLRPHQTGPGHTGPVFFSYIGAMTPAILLALLVQAPQASAPRPFAYRGYAPGMSYRDLDRKSTRLNSSHGYISYAVFCLKKKKNNKKHIYYIPYQRYETTSMRECT